MTILLQYWKEIGLGLLIVGLVTFGKLWMTERDDRIRSEAEAELLTERADAAVEEARQADSARAAADSAADRAQEEVNEARREAELQRERAAEAGRRARVERAAAGDSLRATLDSLHAVVPVPLRDLVQTARVQHRREQAAQRSVVAALEAGMEARARETAAADSTASLWRRRYDVLEDAHEARGRALAEARAALDARQREVDDWTDHWTLKVAALATVGYAGYQVGRQSK